MIRNAASSGSPELVNVANSTVKAVSSFRLKRLDSNSSRFQIETSALCETLIAQRTGRSALRIGSAVGLERR